MNWSVVSGLGTLSGATTASITYNAPTIVSSASSVSFTATSVTDPTKSSTFTVNLVPRPVIATPTFPGGTVGTSYSYGITETGGIGPFTWTALALPAGLSLSSSTGGSVTVQGTPTTAGASQTVTIKANDAKGLTNTLNSSITITAASCTCIASPCQAGEAVVPADISQCRRASGYRHGNILNPGSGDGSGNGAV